MEEKIEVLCELLSVSSYLCSLFVDSELAMNDGEIVQSQNFTKQGQGLLKTVIGDTFAEYKEEFETNEDDICDYDTPSMLLLSKFCNQICFHASTMFSLLYKGETDVVFEDTAKLVAKDINTVEQIYNQIFEN